MRTTIDMPDALYRKTKAAAALRGSTVKDLVIRAVEREVEPPTPVQPARRRIDVPLIKTWKGKKLDLTDFDFDDLLA